MARPHFITAPLGAVCHRTPWWSNKSALFVDQPLPCRLLYNRRLFGFGALLLARTDLFWRSTSCPPGDEDTKHCSHNPPSGERVCRGAQRRGGEQRHDGELKVEVRIWCRSNASTPVMAMRNPSRTKS